MKELISVKPEKNRLINLLEEINKGEIKIPLFQRDFVWEDKQMLDLFDSMKKGYPIGSLLFWMPEDDYRCYDNFGPYRIESKGKNVKYVLDGFQRLSTLFGVLSNPSLRLVANTANQDSLKRYEIYYDLDDEEFTYNRKKNRSITLIPLSKLLDTFDFLEYTEQLKAEIDNEVRFAELLKRARSLAKSLIDYEIPFIDIRGGDITSSVDIFSRINSKGLKISPDWMVSALSYNPDNNFLFSETINKFLVELEVINYGDLSRETILHCIESSTNRPYFDVKIESVCRSSNFDTLVHDTLKNIKLAIEFLTKKVLVFEYKLLPYNNQLIFLTEFFRLNPSPTNVQIDALVRWFWVTSYSNYFTINSLSKQRKALSHFKAYALEKEDDPVYYSDEDQKFNSYPFPERVDFGSVRSKTLILFMLKSIYSAPKDIYTDFKLKLRYISPYNKSTSSVIPYVSGDDNLDEHILDFQVNRILNPEYTEKLFLEFCQGNLAEVNDDILYKRKKEIQVKEKRFVQTLGITYNEKI